MDGAWRIGLVAGVTPALAQDIEPRAYSNAPVGVNFVIAGYIYTRGGLSFDPSLPVTDEDLRTSNAVVAYARVLDLWGMSAKFDAIVPYTWLSGSAVYAGQPVERVVDGFANSRFRLSVNLYGAPALRLPEYASYKQDVIVGASLQVGVPWGQYDDTRVVNIGMNRWAFKPEIGVSKASGPWTLELTAGATFFTDNTNFYGGQKREQDPIYSFQTHAIYNFRSGIWASLDATYFIGGRTTFDGVRGNDYQRQRRVGAHRQQFRPLRHRLAVPLGRRPLKSAPVGAGRDVRSIRRARSCCGHPTMKRSTPHRAIMIGWQRDSTRLCASTMNGPTN